MSGLLVWFLLQVSPPLLASADLSMRFNGSGAAAPDHDRVKIPIDDPHRPADIGAGDFTVEWWIKARSFENETPPCEPGPENWIFGNILLDRDVYGWGDWGDWGVSLAGGRVAFGVASSDEAQGICSSSRVDDGRWHHVAVARRASDGRLRIFVDGVLEADSGSGPLGDLSYRDGRDAPWPNEPFLVIGAEKHDVGLAVPSFAGWIDELRLSTVERYDSTFVPPRLAFRPDPSTAALYHFDEGSGSVLVDDSGRPGGPSHGEVRFGGSPPGPSWSEDSPLSSEAVPRTRRAGRRLAPANRRGGSGRFE